MIVAQSENTQLDLHPPFSPSNSSSSSSSSSSQFLHANHDLMPGQKAPLLFACFLGARCTRARTSLRLPRLASSRAKSRLASRLPVSTSESACARTRSPRSSGWLRRARNLLAISSEIASHLQLPLGMRASAHTDGARQDSFLGSPMPALAPSSALELIRLQRPLAGPVQSCLVDLHATRWRQLSYISQ